jgi:putative transposase
VSHSFTHLVYHVVFATKHRTPCLSAEVRSELWPYLAELIREERGLPLAVNGMPEHVHVLGRLWQAKAVSDVIQRLKAESSRWLKERFGQLDWFAWQPGYGAFSVSRSQIETVQRYVENQEQHHAGRDYLGEFRGLLIAHGFEVSEEELADV